MGATFAALAAATSGPAAAAGGPYDYAVGSAKNRAAEFSQSPFQLEVSAHRQSPTEVTGHVRGSGDLTGDLPGGDFVVEGPVTCLRVEPKPLAEALVTGPGNRAAIKYVVKTSGGSLAPPVGDVIEVFVEDNGNPEDGQPVDGNATLLPEPPELSDPRTCDDPNVAGQPYNPVDQGDYRVYDGPVAP
ncbi:MAG TPA: hypothetical protein VF520_15545 [Thermoleophilaceae bacterium]|jgi:hypothetical protein